VVAGLAGGIFRGGWASWRDILWWLGSLEGYFVVAELVGGTFVAAGSSRGIFCGLWDNSSAILGTVLAKGTFFRLWAILRDILAARLNKGTFCNCLTKLKGILLLLGWLEGYLWLLG
jgi:hypothetical protein